MKNKNTGKVRTMKPRPKTYIFHRGDYFYPIELRDDKDAIANALCNPGTTKVTDLQGKEIWGP